MDEDVAERLEGTFAANSGSGGGCFGLEMLRRWASVFCGSTPEDIADAGGEYWVPTSTVGFTDEEADNGLLWEFGLSVDD